MKIIYYVEHDHHDLKLLVDVEPMMDGYACEDYSIQSISIVTTRKQFKLSAYSRLFREIADILEADGYFTETIEQAWLDIRNDRDIDEALEDISIRGVYA